MRYAWVLGVALAGCGSVPGPSVPTESATSGDHVAASASPAPSSDRAADATAAAAPAYVVREGLPFTVLDHAEADALFEDVDECVSDFYGIGLEYPSTWFTNTENPPPDCTFFGADPVEADDDTRLVPLVTPPHVAISFQVVRTPLTTIALSDVVLEESVSIGGVNGRRREERAPDDPTALTYAYMASLEADAGGWKLLASTSSMGHDYELNKAVLDRMMASVRFLDGPP